MFVEKKYNSTKKLKFYEGPPLIGKPLGNRGSISSGSKCFS